MLRHRESHGEKRLACTSCTKTFYRKDHLDRHRTLLHNDSNQAIVKQSYVCDFCTKQFAKKFNLKRHIILCETAKKKVNKEQTVLQKMKYFSNLYREELELGKYIAKCLNENPDIIEQSLQPEYKHALSLYQQSRSTIDTNVITLNRPFINSCQVHAIKWTGTNVLGIQSFNTIVKYNYLRTSCR
jgi:uncharacterized Zn-finger protein